MNQPQFERLLHDWLRDEAPREAPDWLLAGVEGLIEDVVPEGPPHALTAWRLVAVTAVLIAAVLTAAALQGLVGGPAVEPAPEPTGVRWTEPVGAARTLDMSVVGGELWVSVAGAPRIIRLDGDDGRVIGELDLSAQMPSDLPGPAYVDAVTAAHGSAWLVSPEAGQVFRVDPESLQAVDAFEIGRLPGAVAAGPDAIWILALDWEQLWRLDPESGRVTGTVNLNLGWPGVWWERGHIAAEPDAVWISVDDQVVRVDPNSLEIRATIPVGGTAGGLTVLDSVWVTVPGRDVLVEIDPERDAVVSEAPAGADPFAVTNAHGLVWVADRREALVRAFDPTTGDVVATFDVGRGTTSITASGRSVWVLNQIDATVSHIRIGADLSPADGD